ncbi:uncharacterized protein [Physcomitrium patens]|uniref:uncharacterized protein isoform X3 n=1 Tax=Physcomitrium patens TaxID=3218 RepID=UPI000D16CE6E|nr:histone-lysine N-methyltransferase 2D-like isoform X3 [Physcomitrium patens]|eukprot:XP_024374336.1 histone-lysine N-methyltransferase 2D-like isoform X3 [Physcomitrella patens]
MLEDETGPPVSGAAVDAYTERLKGVLGDGGPGVAGAAYGLARAGNGSLKPIATSTPALAPAASSAVPPATGNSETASSVPAAHPSPLTLPITQSQWAKLTPQQQQLYRQQHHLRQQALLNQQRQQQQAGVQQAGAGASGQPQRRPGSNISQGISFGELMPLLQPHLPPAQSEQLSALYQRFKQNEITREDFVRGARAIVGDQVLVQTIRQMHKQHPQGGPSPGVSQQTGAQHAVSQQTGTQQQAVHQQLGSSSQIAAAQQSGPAGQPATSSGSNSQPTNAVAVSQQQSTKAAIEQNDSVPSVGVMQAQSLQQQQQQHQDQQQQGHNSSQPASVPAGQQQPKVEEHPQGSSQSGQSKAPALLQSSVPARPNLPNVKAVEQSQQSGDTSSQGTAVTSPSLQQVKNEVDKAVGPTQAVRPLHMPASGSFGGFQARPSTLSTPHTPGGQVHPGHPGQVPRAPTPMQFSALPQTPHMRPAFSQAMSETSQQSDQKPLTKYAKAKLRKEQKKAEEEERARKMAEDEKMRRQQPGGAGIASPHPQTPQTAQSVSMPVAVPQPHPKLLESKQQAAQSIHAVKQEAHIDQQTGGALQRVPVTPMQTGQMAIKAPGQVQLPETVVSQAIPAVARDPNAQVPGSDKSQLNTPPAGGPMSRYTGLPGLAGASQLVAVGGTAAGSTTPQAGGSVRQGPPYVLASELRSPAMNFNSGMSTPAPKPGAGGGGGAPGGPTAQALNTGAKTPVKKPAVGVGQKKPGEALPATAQPASKKQKTQGAEADQSIDQLNDVTAVSGVNLREEEEQLLAGPKEESRTTEAMRKFVQEEEERLFLERGPLRAKAQAIAAKCGLRSVSEDVERCISMAAEERVRSMLYKLIKYSKQRCDVEKDAHSTVVTSDPRRQVLLMKKRAKEAMEKKLADENERLRKLNEKKDKGALADGDNEDLRLKAQKAQQEEDDKMRAKAANVAARAAVGATDMLSKWQMMAAQGLAKRQGGDTANESARTGGGEETSGSREQERRQENGEVGKASGSGRVDNDGDGSSGAAVAGRPTGPGSGTGRGGAVRRIGAPGGRQPRSISMKDVIALLEREPQMSKSTFLYRLYERDRKAESSRRI